MADNIDNRPIVAVNVQCMLDAYYYKRLVERAKKNDRSARGEAMRIIKAVLDKDIQISDPVSVCDDGGASL